jgi:hypothetical protein
MLDILQNKLLSWSPDKADQFFNNMPRFVPNGSRIWEVSPTGYFLYDSVCSTYFDYNGKVYTLILGDVSGEYIQKQALSDSSAGNDSIAVERPQLIQTTTIYGVTYTYVEETRPYNSLGINILNLTLVPGVSKTERIAMVATAFSDIKEQLKNLANLTNQKDYSEYVDIYEHVYYNTNTEKYFLVGKFHLKKSLNPSHLFDQYNAILQNYEIL